jgi:hypothetical protein
VTSHTAWASLPHQSHRINSSTPDIMAKSKEDKLKALRKMRLQSMGKHDILGGLNQETQLALVKIHQERVAAGAASLDAASASSVPRFTQAVADVRPTTSSVARTQLSSPFFSSPVVPQSIFGMSASSSKGKNRTTSASSKAGKEAKRKPIQLGKTKNLVGHI